MGYQDEPVEETVVKPLTTTEEKAAKFFGYDWDEWQSLDCGEQQEKIWIAKKCGKA